MLNPEYILVFTVTPAEVLRLLAQHNVYPDKDECIVMSNRNLAYLVHNPRGNEGEAMVIRNSSRALDVYEDKMYAKLSHVTKDKLRESGILNINDTELNMEELFAFKHKCRKHYRPFDDNCQS